MDGIPAFWTLHTNTGRISPLLPEFSVSVTSKEWGNCHTSKHPGEMVLEAFWFSSCFIISNGLHCHPSCQCATALVRAAPPPCCTPKLLFPPPAPQIPHHPLDVLGTAVQNWLLFYMYIYIFYIPHLWSKQYIQDDVSFTTHLTVFLSSYKSAFNTRLLQENHKTKLLDTSNTISCLQTANG